jgi:hypothetical protein
MHQCNPWSIYQATCKDKAYIKKRTQGLEIVAAGEEVR